MSDQSQGPGWWVASDGKWYPPETHPDYRPPPPPSQAAPVRGERRARSKARWIVGAVVGAIASIAILIGVLSSGDDDDRTTQGSNATSATDSERTRGQPTTAAPPRELDLTVESGFSSGVDSIGTRYTSVGALVTNPNATLAAYDVKVVFNLLGPSGEILDTDTANVPYISPSTTVPVASLQIGFDIPVEPSSVQVSIAADVGTDRGWAGVEFMTGEGVELQTSEAKVDATDFGTRLSFTVTNPSTSVAEFASWHCVLRRGGQIVGGQASGVSDPIVPAGSVRAEANLSVEDLTADEVICRAWA